MKNMRLIKIPFSDTENLAETIVSIETTKELATKLFNLESLASTHIVLCEGLGLVNMQLSMNNPVVLIVDDTEQAMQLNINTRASLLYGTQLHNHYIFGDVFVAYLERDDAAFEAAKAAGAIDLNGIPKEHVFTPVTMPGTIKTEHIWQAIHMSMMFPEIAFAALKDPGNHDGCSHD